MVVLQLREALAPEGKQSEDDSQENDYNKGGREVAHVEPFMP